VLTPAYPGFEVEVEALNADPTPIEQITVPQIVEHLEAVVGGLERPPIIMGHCARRRVHPDPARSRFRGRWGGDRFGADRGRQADTAVPGPRQFPGVDEPSGRAFPTRH
jgi:hypothetical protein